MTSSKRKNRVALGFVIYFVGLSLLGFTVYRWSQPAKLSQHAKEENVEASDSSSAVVSYENIESATPEFTENDLSASVSPETTEPEAPASADSSGSSEAAPSEEEEWN